MQGYPDPAPPLKRNNLPLILIAGCCGCSALTIPILAAVMIPVFAQARERARETYCLSNEKQQGLAILMYVQDYDEVFLPSRQWMEITAPYIKRETVFQCPTAKSKYGQSGQPVYGYSYYSKISMQPLANALQPQITVMEFESTTLTKSASDPFTSFPNSGRHSQRDNIGFMDGHAKPLSIDAIMSVQDTMKQTKLFGKPSKKTH